MFAQALSLAALAGAVAAQSTLKINTPPALTLCEPSLITWEGGAAPYIVSVIPGGQQGAAALKYLSQGTNDHQYTWNIDIEAGTQVTLKVLDNTGLSAFSAPVSIQGTDRSCLEGEGSASSSAAEGSSSEAPAPETSSEAAPESSSDAAAPSESTSEAAAESSSAEASSSAASESSASASASAAASPSSAASSSAAASSTSTSSRAPTSTTSKAAASPSASADNSGAKANVASFGILAAAGALAALF